MNLKEFCQLKDVREKLNKYFPKPSFPVKKKILAPPRTKNWALVGTAFDYLLRFFIKKHNPQSQTRQWIAEKALEILASSQYKEFYTKGKAVVKRARKNYEAYLESGDINDDLLTSVIQLSKLDNILRADIYPNTWEVDQLDLVDLRNLISIVNSKFFQVKRDCFLNPTFGGVADADLIIDGKLIDIKTVKECKLRRDMFDQLIFYYTLQSIENIREQRREITHLGIYFSRHAYLHLYNVSEIINPSTFPEFLSFFVWKLKSFLK